MIERTVEQHLECAFNIMRGFDIKEEKNYWDVMSHIHDASMILKNKPERSRYDWIDWCTCDQRQRELEEWREKRQKDLRLQGFIKIELPDGIESFVKKICQDNETNDGR